MLDVRDAAVRGARHDSRAKLDPRCAPHLQKLLFVGRQTLNLMGDHIAQVARHSILRSRRPRRHAPLPVNLNDRPLADEIVDNRRDEEGLALGAREEPPGQSLGHFDLIEAQRQILHDFSLREPIEGDLGAVSVDLKILMNGPEGMTGNGDVSNT